MSGFDLIIFDCDGTLVDSEYINNRSLLEALSEGGFTGYDLDHAYKNWVGTTISGILLSIQMETGRKIPETLIPAYMQKVASYQKTDLRSVPGAADMVRTAKDHFKICVASNGERRNVISSLRVAGLLDYFHEDHVFSKSQVKNPKPYPDLFLFAAQYMGAEPSACLVIEDSPTGVLAGVAAGMTTYGFSGSSHDPEKQAALLDSAGAKEVFSDFIHIRRALGL